MIYGCIFLDIQCEGEGGALYIRKATMDMAYSCFVFCRTSRKEEQKGGNAWNIGGRAFITDTHVLMCSINTQCGDSICMFCGGEIDLNRKNSSHCTDNEYGEDICFEYSDKTCMDSFNSIFNCSLFYLQSAVFGSGRRCASYSNYIGCRPREGLFSQINCALSFEKCCFFQISNARNYGTASFIDCIGDVDYSGVTKVSIQSTNAIFVHGGCMLSNRFSTHFVKIRIEMILVHFFAIDKYF